ncbi:hypothetical protein VP01_1228g3 [Puccinia sorghi]|uniref:Uncharacterized protein n=1 Tax=Puccinia sorghi TaxID=27349 RepID=A0A0L6VPT0_9BASI|nr:hypothetical protein VP01_1228g3 [Puccinia sorghi]
MYIAKIKKKDSGMSRKEKKFQHFLSGFVLFLLSLIEHFGLFQGSLKHVGLQWMVLQVSEVDRDTCILLHSDSKCLSHIFASLMVIEVKGLKKVLSLELKPTKLIAAYSQKFFFFCRMPRHSTLVLDGQRPNPQFSGLGGRFLNLYIVRSGQLYYLPNPNENHLLNLVGDNCQLTSTFPAGKLSCSSYPHSLLNTDHPAKHYAGPACCPEIYLSLKSTHPILSPTSFCLSLYIFIPLAHKENSMVGFTAMNSLRANSNVPASRAATNKLPIVVDKKNNLVYPEDPIPAPIADFIHTSKPTPTASLPIVKNSEPEDPPTYIPPLKKVFFGQIK